VGRREDVAKLGAFLLSAEGGFVTGANFVGHGGMIRKMICL
jgi:NAD(P)-dependent dehydrogenase (short-subunit alcohol dehydrogenase family)